MGFFAFRRSSIESHCFGICGAVDEVSHRGGHLTAAQYRVRVIYMEALTDTDYADYANYDDWDYDPWNDVEQGRYDDDPSPYDGTYSEC